jgi:hypothetical protein
MLYEEGRLYILPGDTPCRFRRIARVRRLDEGDEPSERRRRPLSDQNNTYLRFMCFIVNVLTYSS